MIDSASRSRSVRLVNPRVDAVRVDSEPDERWAVGSYNEFDYAYEPEPRQQFQRYSDDEYARAL